MNYHVAKINGRWITKGDGLTVGIHGTQQQAIEAGKRRAIKDRSTISWDDKDGNLQGQVDYSTQVSRRNA